MSEGTEQKLAEVLAFYPRMAIAVSGGVDSLTLSAFATRNVPDVTLYHARSEAVPEEAAERLQALARKYEWTLVIMDAGELADARYLSNPVNRCFYCKQNLYAAIRQRTDAPIASGTNLDDLAEYRPGLQAASEAGVFHPFVQAGFTKQMVRALADSLDLTGISAQPASPCLSSRVRTGVAINAGLLRLIDQAEMLVRRRLGITENVRCRIHADHIMIQLPPCSLDSGLQADLESRLNSLFAGSEWSGLCDHIEWGVYMQGSSFATEVLAGPELTGD